MSRMDVIPKDTFRARVARLVREWPFGEADALVLVQGMQRKDEDALDVGEGVWPRTSVMHQWLFCFEFPEFVFVVFRSGKMIIWTRERKLNFFREVQGPDLETICRAHPQNLE
ncbi:unnamed protein product, partial [Effrenium voratum]